MATTNRDFIVKNGLIVQGATATVNGNTVLTTASSIDALSDVVISTPSNGQVLSYNGTNWVNSAASGSGLPSQTGNAGEFLVTDGTNASWSNTIIANATGTTGLIVKGLASQSANLQEWQNSSSAVIASVASTGLIRSSIGFASTAPNLTLLQPDLDTGGMGFITQVSTNKGLIIRGAASQTADLQQWQNSAGTVLSSINSAGRLFVNTTTNYFSSIQAVAYTAGAHALSVVGFSSGTTTAARIIAGAAGQVSLTVSGAASQTANLTEWVNSSGTVLSWVDSAGSISLPRTGTIRFNGGVGVDRAYITSNINNDLIFATAGGTESFRLYGGATPSGALITNGNAGAIGLAIKGAASQSGNLQEWQDSSGNRLSAISSAGSIFIGTGGSRISGVNGDLLSIANSAAVVPITARGAASQTANLQEWQNSAGTVLASIASIGTLVAPYARIYTNDASIAPIVARGAASQSANLQEWQNSSAVTLFRVASDGTPVTASGVGLKVGGTGISGLFTVSTGSASTIGAVIRGATSQTADLQQWQNSAGSTLAYVRNDGVFFGNQGILSTGWIATGNYIAGAALIANPSGPTVIPILVRGAASQTANLQEWQDSAGTAQTVISSAGRITSKQRMSIGFPVATALFDAHNNFGNDSDATRIIIIARAAAAQTANLQEWQSSAGAVLAKVESNGVIDTPILRTNSITESGDTNTRITISGSGHNALIPAVSASHVPLILKAAASQTANLQQWQDSSGNVLSNVDSFGRLRIRSTTTSAFSAAIGAASASTVGLMVQGAASQTANLQEWQNSGGNNVAYVQSTGEIRAPGFGNLATYLNSMFYPENAGPLVYTGQAGNVALRVRNANASPTANLQEWQNNAGAVLSSVSSTGYITLPGAPTIDNHAATKAYVDSVAQGLDIKASVHVATTAAGTLATSFANGQTVDGVVLVTGDRILIKNQATASENGIYTVNASGAPTRATDMDAATEFPGAFTFVEEGTVNADTGWVCTNNAPVTVGTTAITFSQFSGAGTYTAGDGLSLTGTAFAVDSTVVRTSGTQTIAGDKTFTGNININGILDLTNTGVINALDMSNNSIVGVNQLAFADPGPSEGLVWSNGNFSLFESPNDLTSNTSGNLQIVTGVAGSYTRRMTINTSGQVEIPVATGTAPLVISSTTAVSNLNADLLDGNHASAFATLSGSTFTGQIISTLANSTTTGGGQIYLNGATGNRIDFNQNGIAAPSFTTRSVGTKIVLYPNISGSQVDYAIGIDTSTFWQSISGSNNSFKWYAGTTNIATLTGAGAFSAVTKSFDIEHPTKEGMRLRYGSLEGPENGVYVRGKSKEKSIELPDYWTGLVHEDTITVNLTAIGSGTVFVKEIINNTVVVGGTAKEFFFTVFGERKDVDKLTVEY